MATPSSFALGQIQSARSRSSGFASSTAIPKPASAISSMSFSPSPNETTRSSEMPSCCGHEGDPRSLRHRGVAELEQVGEGGRQEEAIAERRGERLAEGRDLGRVGDGDELRRRLRQPRREVADLLDRDVLEVGVHPRVLGVLRRRRGGRRRNSSASARASVSRAIASRAVSSGIGSWSTNVPLAGSTTAAPW